MFSGNFFGNFDLTLILLYGFWAFFFSLVVYLNREGKREGYPMVTDTTGAYAGEGWTGMPSPKTFILPHGAGTVQAPRPEMVHELPIGPVRWSGDPIDPLGDPMQLGLGPPPTPCGPTSRIWPTMTSCPPSCRCASRPTSLCRWTIPIRAG